MGAIRFALEVKIDVPGRPAIADFGDTPLAQWTTPALTTVRFPNRETDLGAGRLMLERLFGRMPTLRVVRLGFKILSRDSA